MKITIGHLYPELLNVYGDTGNIRSIVKRCQWRGIEAEVKSYALNDEIDFSQLDIVILGGGSEKEERLACEKLQEHKDALKSFVETDGVMLALCGGYQMLGSYYMTGTEKVEGLGIVDMHTEAGDERVISNVVLQSELAEMPVVGFENHAGRVNIKNNKPFGKVLFGFGNDGKSGYEGVVYKNVIGTYLYGPLLPKNPQIADLLIKRALEKKYGETVELASLDDSQEKEANDYVYNRFVK